MAETTPFSTMRMLTMAGKWGGGALALTVAALGVPTINSLPNALPLIGVLMILGGVLLFGVATLEAKTHPDRSESRGRQLGAVLVGLFGVLLAGLIPGLSDPQQVADDIGHDAFTLAGASNPFASSAARTTAAGNISLVIEAAPAAEPLAAGLRRQIPGRLANHTLQDGARRVSIAGTASGRYANLAAGQFVGRLDVNLRAEGDANVCTLIFRSSGLQTVDNAALQIADQLTPRVIALMNGEEQC